MLEITSVPALADLDKDGDWDALIGASDGRLRYFENTGGATNPVFSERIGPDNPLDGVDVGDESTPALADLDNDKDWDVLIGTDGGRLRYFENTGNASNPVFSQRLGPDNPLDGVDVGNDSVPVLADLDNDRDWDVLIDASGSTPRYFENTGNVGNLIFSERFGSNNPLAGVDVSSEISAGGRRGTAAPALADLDNDGDWDALIGAWDGTLRYFENIGGIGNPVFSERLGSDNPLDEVDVSNERLGEKIGTAVPALADLDNDGDWDVLIGTFDGMLRYFENTGNVGKPAFSERLGSENPLIGVRTAENETGTAAPALADLDNDGDWDVLIGAYDGTIRYIENTGNAGNPVFSEHLSTDNPLDGVDVGSWSVPALADLDNDGDWDALIGAWDGTLRYFKNTGDAGKPIFSERLDSENPFDGVNVSSKLSDIPDAGVAAPILADLDNDGDLDALIGALDGSVHYFENTRLTNEALPSLHASFPGGFYNVQRHPLDIQLRCLDDCLRIHYTRNGSVPDLTSPVFSGPLSVTATTTVKFLSVDALGNPGTVRTEQYIIDNEAPRIRITSPADNSYFGAIPAIQGNAADNLTDAGLQRIELQIQNGSVYLDDNPRNPLATVLTWIRLEPTESWSYDLADIPFPSGIYTITARAFDYTGNVSEHAITVTVRDPAFTTLTLHGSHPAIRQNDPVDLSGKLTQFGVFYINLAGLSVELAIFDESNKPVGETQTEHTNKRGEYLFTHVDGFNQKGVFTLQTRFGGTETLQASESNRAVLLVGKSAGYAILVQGRIHDDTGEAHAKTLNQVYQHLKARGFLDENILYFTRDAAKNAIPYPHIDNFLAEQVTFVQPDKGAIEHAIVNWAYERMAGSPAPLYLILVDHGDRGRFILDDDASVITPEELNTWLGKLENRLSYEVLEEEPRVVIVSACFSGSFIHTSRLEEPEGLSKPGRIIISSAAENEVSYKGPREEADGIRGGSYFTDALFEYLGQGETLRNAFTLSTADTELFTRRNADLVNSTDIYRDNAAQHPLLDDNGDNRGSNTLYSGGDGDKAVALVLGVGGEIGINTNDNPADILAVTRLLLLEENRSEATLWLAPGNLLHTDSPSVQIREPKAINEISIENDRREQVELDLPRHFMKFSDATGHYEFKYDGFVTPGRYDIFYTLQDDRPVIDPETGRVIGSGKQAPVRHSAVYKNKPDNAPPPVTLIYPPDGAKTNWVLAFDWLPVEDPDGVRYVLILINRAENFITYLAEDLTQSRHAVTERTRILTDPVRHVFRNGLQDLTEYDWQVAAVDGYGAFSISETRRFQVDNTDLPIGDPSPNSELYAPATLQGEDLTLPMVVVPCGGNERYEVYLRETTPNSGVFAVADYSIVWGFDAEEACFDSQSLLLHIPRLEGEGGGQEFFLTYDTAAGGIRWP
ncbi:MAG: hypothetical protein GY862_14655 [Gammaproteobacteria bacterium]|nr:hypothetical protein [Gammaproteobacteria bacterium]